MEFSFFVLADAGAFVTQAPARITPSDLVLRPFSTFVWGAFGLAFLVVMLAILAQFYVEKSKYFE